MDQNPAQSVNANDTGSVSPRDTPVPSTGPADPVSTSGVAGKEFEGGVSLGSLEAPGITEIGKDGEIPKEVETAGVRILPTAVSLPPSVQKLGVQPTGVSPQIIQPQQKQTVPLTDDQISQGKKQSIQSSWRWLAEWCVRKLKQLHMVLSKSERNY